MRAFRQEIRKICVVVLLNYFQERHGKLIDNKDYISEECIESSCDERFSIFIPLRDELFWHWSICL